MNGLKRRLVSADEFAEYRHHRVGARVVNTRTAKDNGLAGPGSRADQGVRAGRPVRRLGAFAWLLSGLLPTVSTLPMAILRWLSIALASTSVMIGFDRVTRRLLPLAVLFSLTLAFPDQAPSRFKVAMRIGTTLQLRRDHRRRQGRADR